MRRAAVLFSALVVPACFNVTKIDLGDGGPCAPLVIDDFEDGDLTPELGQLGPWTCITYNPQGQPVSCGVGTGGDGGHALFAQFEIQDPVDGTANAGGAGLESFVIGAPLDLRGFQELVVSVQLTSGSPPLPALLALDADLNCSSAQVQNSSVMTFVDVVQQVPVTIGPGWATFHLQLSSFVQPQWMDNRLTGGTSDCLARVDGLVFAVTPNLPDGQSAAGTLGIDNVQLVPKCAP